MIMAKTIFEEGEVEGPADKFRQLPNDDFWQGRRSEQEADVRTVDRWVLP